MTKKTTAVAEIAPTEVTTPSVPITEPFMLIAHAVQNGQLDIETIKELRALQKEMKADEAQEAFVQAMASFQAECPVVEKKKPVKSKTGQIVYYYAPLDSIVSQVAKAIAKNGLAYTFDISSDEKELTATCKVTHTQGHSEVFSFKVPVGSESYMTEVQKFGARATFAKRNAFCNAFGISTGDEDTDATQTDKPKAPLSVKSQIIFLLKTLGFVSKDRKAIEDKVKSLTTLDLVETNFDEIKSRLEILVQDQNEDHSVQE